VIDFFDWFNNASFGLNVLEMANPLTLAKANQFANGIYLFPSQDLINQGDFLANAFIKVHTNLEDPFEFRCESHYIGRDLVVEELNRLHGLFQFPNEPNGVVAGHDTGFVVSPLVLAGRATRRNDGRLVKFGMYIEVAPDPSCGNRWRITGLEILLKF